MSRTGHIVQRREELARCTIRMDRQRRFEGECLENLMSDRPWVRFAALLVGLVAVGACSIDVREEARDAHKKEVDIRTPMGAMSVRTGVEAPDTGLAVYPGARPLRDGHEPESANVSIGAGRFGLNVVATQFESEAEPAAVLAHYREAMHAYGDVHECHGDIDFRGRRGEERPICKRRRFSRETQLVVGTESRHRLVSVKPRGSGSEFAVVYIQTQS